MIITRFKYRNRTGTEKPTRIEVSRNKISFWKIRSQIIWCIYNFYKWLFIIDMFYIY